jgi:uncharacterized protein (TIGR02266 family)
VRHDNRRYGRSVSQLRCWCEAQDVTLYVRVGNLSEGGLFLRTSTPLARGSRTRLSLRQGESQELRATATVVWTREEDEEGPAGMGLVFDELDEEARERLRRIISGEGRTHGRAS